MDISYRKITKNNADFFLVDKPIGMSSFKVVSYFKKLTGIKKIGHSGTLDPFATGLLILGIGRSATKQISDFQSLDKEYKATIKLGFSTDSDDLTGEKIENEICKVRSPDDEIKKVIKSFVGEIEQIPSTISAKKVNGKRAYKLYRAGEIPELKPVKINIYNIDVHKITANEDGTKDVDITVNCSTGTYIRALARDIGKALKTGGHAIKLRRTKIGDWTI